MKKTVLILLGTLLILVMVLVANTLRYPFAQLSETQQEPMEVAIGEESVKRFAEGLKIATVSHVDSAMVDYTAFDAFVKYIYEAYPEVCTKLDDTLINGYNIVLKWKGKNTQLSPLLFMAHYDVVPPGPHEEEEDDAGQSFFNFYDEALPAASAEATAWEHGPFSGVVKDGRIYGRGALDMKGVVFSLLEAIDALLAKGFTPERDCYFSFGPDEEVGGLLGAAKAAAYFKNKNLRFEAIYDEGGIIAAPGTVKGINQNLAFIGCAEKGVVSYKIAVKGLGGHASMPPLQTSAGMAAIIMQRLEQNQMKQRIVGPVEGFLKVAGAGMGFMSRMAIANRWLFEGMLLKQLQKTPPSNALTRTTTAITMLKGSDGSNVLPQETEIVVNFRILPGETSADVLKHIEKACEGFDVNISFYRIPVEPSPLSPADGHAYEVLTASIAKLYPTVVIAPYLTIGATDCKHMTALSDRIYRFIPVLLSEAEQRSIHNFNEYISIANYARMIAHYKFLLSNYDAM